MRDLNFVFRNKRVYWIFNCACLLIAICLNSRSFLIGYAASTLFLYFTNNVKASIKLKLVSFSLLLSGLLLMTFAFKADSSSGRILVYKISLKMLSENFLTGIGYGKFKLYYGLYQPKYFEENNYTTKELLLADNTKHAFNDYLKTATEFGIGSLVIIALLFFITFRLVSISLKKRPNLPILKIACSQIIAIAVAALFTHVFEHAFFQFVFVQSLLLVVYFSNLFSLSKFKLIICNIALVIFVLGFHYGQFLYHYKQSQTLQKTKYLLNAGYIEESLVNCLVFYPSLNNDIDFFKFLCKHINCLWSLPKCNCNIGKNQQYKQYKYGLPTTRDVLL